MGGGGRRKDNLVFKQWVSRAEGKSRGGELERYMTLHAGILHTARRHRGDRQKWLVGKGGRKGGESYEEFKSGITKETPPSLGPRFIMKVIF